MVPLPVTSFRRRRHAIEVMVALNALWSVMVMYWRDGLIRDLAVRTPVTTTSGGVVSSAWFSAVTTVWASTWPFTVTVTSLVPGPSVATASRRT